SGYKEYVAGMMAGLATVIVGHPFDTVKVKLQKHNTGAAGVKYRGALHCAVRVLKTEGVKGLYRGATSSFVGMAFESSLAFGIYSQAKQLLQAGDSERPDPVAAATAGAVAGGIISFVICPSELLKCRMQVQVADSSLRGGNRYDGPMDCAIRTVKNEGLSGLFRGGGATFLRESIANAVFFCTYEHLRYYLHRSSASSSDLTPFFDVGVAIVTGGTSGIACWCAVLPIDVAKTIIQTSSEATQSRNPFRTLESIYKRAGPRGCYTGLGPTIARAFPANAAAIVAWELSCKMLGIQR
ncbi:hypothetical protein M569_05818, partial [Genlisea aurea]